MPDQEKSFGRKLLSFFVQEAPPHPAPAPPAPTGAPETAPVRSAPAPVPAGSVDARFVDHFAGLLTKANLQGPDYYEFREILRNLTNLGLPEDKQFQAAWASFKAMGGAADAAVLTTTANQYLATLNADREAFAQSAEKALSDKVGGLQAEQKRLQAENEAIARQIAELQQKREDNDRRLASLTGELEEQTGKIRQNRANYEATFATFAGQIKSDVANIAAYLK
jgi:hypothetical protein